MVATVCRACADDGVLELVETVARDGRLRGHVRWASSGVSVKSWGASPCGLAEGIEKMSRRSTAASQAPTDKGNRGADAA